MKAYFILILLSTVINAEAQNLNKIFQYSGVPDNNSCQENTYDIYSIAHDSRGNYYYTSNYELGKNRIVALDNSGNILWDDTVRAIGSQAKSFAFVNRWGEVLWFHHKVGSKYGGHSFHVNTYNFSGKKLSSLEILTEKTFINEVKTWGNYYILYGCQGYYDTAIQKITPMLMIQVLLDENGNVINIHRMKSSTDSYTAEPYKYIMHNDRVYLAGYSLDTIRKGQIISYYRFPTIFSCSNQNMPTNQFKDTTIYDAYYNDIIYQNNKIYGAIFRNDSVHNLIVDAFDKDLHLLKRKKISYKFKNYMFLLPYIKLYGDSLHVLCIYSNGDSLLHYSANANIDSFYLRKYRINPVNHPLPYLLQFNDDLSYTLCYADTCSGKQSLIVEHVYLNKNKREQFCYALADSVFPATYFDITPNELYIGARESYRCRVNSAIKTTKSAAYIAHFSIPKNYLNNTSLTIYPNPATQDAFIYLPEYLDRNIVVELISMDGKEIHTDYTIQEGKLKINTSSLNNGLYIVRILNQQAISTAKLLVQH